MPCERTHHASTPLTSKPPAHSLETQSEGQTPLLRLSPPQLATPKSQLAPHTSQVAAHTAHLACSTSQTEPARKGSALEPSFAIVLAFGRRQPMNPPRPCLLHLDCAEIQERIEIPVPVKRVERAVIRHPVGLLEDDGRAIASHENDVLEQAGGPAVAVRKGMYVHKHGVRVT